MIKALLVAVLMVSLFPINSSFSQISDTRPTLGIEFTSSPYNYKAEDGTTVIVGEIENKKNFPVTGVKIWAGFYDDVSKQPLESIIGTTILDVIPPNGKSPYMIISPSPNSGITSVSVNVLGFNSAVPKDELLTIDAVEIDVSDQITFSGTLTNNGPTVVFDTKIHLVFYDVFDPPRVLGIETMIEPEIVNGTDITFEFNKNYNANIFKLSVFAESKNSYSNVVNMEIPKPDILSKLVTINDVSIKDSDGNKLSTISVGETTNIGSEITLLYLDDQESNQQEYVYYIQVKQSGDKAYVEFIGKYDGTFETSRLQLPIVEWTPQSNGLYFVETFVWDENAVPIASKGPIILALVN